MKLIKQILLIILIIVCVYLSFMAYFCDLNQSYFRIVFSVFCISSALEFLIDFLLVTLNGQRIVTFKDENSEVRTNS